MPTSNPQREKQGEGADTEAVTPVSTSLAFSPLHEFVFVAIICCTQLITQSALGLVLVPLQLIGPSFGNDSVNQRSWFLAAYSLTVGTFVLIAGQLGDIYGVKKMFVGGWLWFALWSLVAGLSVYTSSAIFFDICRALQGIGPAFLLPNGLAILSSVYPSGRRKEMIFAFFAAAAPVGFVVGALIGSLFAQLLWWPWGFFSTAIACCIIALGAYLVVPPEEKSPEAKAEFDLIGAVLGVAGLILTNFAWNQAPIVGWSTPYTYTTLIVGIMLLVIFSFHERNCPNPLLPMDIWNRSTVCVITCLGLGWSSFGIWIFYTYQLIEVLRGVSPLIAAVQFVPETISGIAAAIATGYLLSRVRPAWMMFIASTAFFTGCLLSATAPVQQTYWANIFVSMIVMAWG